MFKIFFNFSLFSLQAWGNNIFHIFETLKVAFL